MLSSPQPAVVSGPQGPMGTWHLSCCHSRVVLGQARREGALISKIWSGGWGEGWNRAHVLENRKEEVEASTGMGVAITKVITRCLLREKKVNELFLFLGGGRVGGSCYPFSCTYSSPTVYFLATLPSIPVSPFSCPPSPCYLLSLWSLKKKINNNVVKKKKIRKKQCRCNIGAIQVFWSNQLSASVSSEGWG